MDEHYIELVGIILLLTFAFTMFYQGTMIIKGHRGYRHCEREKQKMDHARKQVENLFKDK